jgi:hypothetical protein
MNITDTIENKDHAEKRAISKQETLKQKSSQI